MASDEVVYKNAHLDSTDVKNAILSYLYRNINRSTLEKEVELTRDSLEYVRVNEYVMCPRMKGVKTWIVLFREQNRYYAVNFLKNYSRARHFEKQNELVIHKLDNQFEKKLYNGTIMEGVYRRDGNEQTIIIDEIHMYAGQPTFVKSKEDRLAIVSNMLINEVHINPNFKLYVSQLYTISKQSISDLRALIDTNDKIQHITFYPQDSPDKIYKYIITADDLIKDVVEKCTFIMEKTKHTDVYNIFTVNNNTKIGIALIPNAAKTKECKGWFSGKVKSLKVSFVKDQRHDKWIPDRVVD